MGIFGGKEREVSEGVVERPETPELPDEVRRLGVEAKTEHFTAQVEKRGQKLIQTPQNDDTKVEIPDEKTLATWEKAKPEEAKRWLAAFFGRLKKMLGLVNNSQR